MLNDDAWNHFWRDSDAESELNTSGYFEVDAKILRNYREPRLMAKFDHSAQLPELFRSQKLGILPISASRYRIGYFDPFLKLGDTGQSLAVRRFEIPEALETLDPADISSEAAAITAAHVSGIIDDFVGDTVVLTQFGKQRSGQFEFSINSTNKLFSQNVKVNGAQIEIDAGFESADAFYLFEAKRNLTTDINIRQLYFPFRAWEKKISKPVIPVFLTFSNDVFTLTEYSFEVIDDYSSVTPVRSSKYSLNDSRLSVEWIAGELSHHSGFIQSDAPFPQADDFEKVLSLVEVISFQGATVEGLAEIFGFDARQSDYYYNAARYLGWATKSEEQGTSKRIATENGRLIFESAPNERKLLIAKKLLEIETLRWGVSQWLVQGSRPSNFSLLEKFTNSKESEALGGDTIARRLRTVESWLNWLIGQVE